MISCALQASEHDDRGPGLSELELTGLAAEDRHQLFVDDLDNLLRRVQRARDLRAESPLAHVAGKGAHHADRNVGVKEGAADLTDRRVDVCLTEASFAA